MSRNINVNPAHYKVAGRERQGEGILQEEQKQAFATQQADGAGDGVPPWEATRHTFVSAQPEPEPARAPQARKAAKAKKAKKAAPAKKAARPTPKNAKRAAGSKAKGAARARGKMRSGGKMRAGKSGKKKMARRSR
jgi:hypothetical protein